LLATRSDKRFTEVFVLAYTPVWVIAVVWAMTSGVLRSWGDLEHLAFGVALALPIFAAPLAPRASAPPLLERHALRFAWLVTLFSVLQCWFGSYLFFEVFGMRYAFHTSIVWNGTPAFLYLMTIAYFATYYTVQVVVWRAIRRRFSSPIATIAARAVLAYVTAFAETAGMANDMLAEWFSYTIARS
jgi:cycloeucalenol cycloisomerase